jgi:hypothetical protein
MLVSLVAKVSAAAFAGRGCARNTREFGYPPTFILTLYHRRIPYVLVLLREHIRI